MKRFGKLVGLVAVVAIMGFSLASCDSGSGGGGGTNIFAMLNTGTPDAGSLTLGGLSITDFNRIRDGAFGAEFRGWMIDEGDFVMVWANGLANDFITLQFNVAQIRGAGVTVPSDDDNLIIVEGNNYDLFVTGRSFSMDGIRVPANTIVAAFWQN